MSDALFIAVVAIVLVAAVIIPYLWRHHRLEQRSRAAEQYAHDYGLHEPVSLHPVVDPELCICTGNCVSACPEHVLAVRQGQTVAVAPASCVGHGLCERSCPVEAIRLVFGSEKRGIELPRLRENFETNVPGLHIIGELGGMGLIRNAFEQARQCVDSLARGHRHNGAELDLVVVGCGPAGLAAALYARHHGLNYVVLEKEDVGGAVRHYPRKKIVMTDSLKVPGYGRLAFKEITKEDLIGLWQDVAQKTSLAVQTGAVVDDVRRTDTGRFVVSGNRGTCEAKRVVLAIGRRGVPRKLGVPGEESPAVAYALREAEAYQNDCILIVGGGDSAIEAAVALAGQPGNRVAISYRGTAFSRVKPANRTAISEAVAAGRVAIHYSTNVTAIEPGVVRLAGESEHFELQADRVFVFVGGTLPTDFIRRCGIEVDVKFGTP